MAANKAVAKTTQNVLEVVIQEKKQDLMNLLPAHVNGERFVKSAMLAAYRNPDILKCDKVSVMAAVYTGAELGLDFTEAKGHAYIVPFGKDAKFMPGYRGLIDLARRAGVVNKMESHVVYDNDEFEVQYGTDSKIYHKPVLVGKRGDIIGAYAIAWMKTGETQSEFMTIEELEGIRKRSKMAKSGPWVTDTGEMYRKTTIRRLFKYLPSSPDLEKALEADSQLYDLQHGAAAPAPPIVNPTQTAPQATPVEPDPPPVATPPQQPAAQGKKPAANAGVEVF